MPRFLRRNNIHSNPLPGTNWVIARITAPKLHQLRLQQKSRLHIAKYHGLSPPSLPHHFHHLQNSQTNKTAHQENVRRPTKYSRQYRKWTRSRNWTMRNNYRKLLQHEHLWDSVLRSKGFATKLRQFTEYFV